MPRIFLVLMLLSLSASQVTATPLGDHPFLRRYPNARPVAQFEWLVGHWVAEESSHASILIIESDGYEILGTLRVKSLTSRLFRDPIRTDRFQIHDTGSGTELLYTTAYMIANMDNRGRRSLELEQTTDSTLFLTEASENQAGFRTDADASISQMQFSMDGEKLVFTVAALHFGEVTPQFQRFTRLD